MEVVLMHKMFVVCAAVCALAAAGPAIAETESSVLAEAKAADAAYMAATSNGEHAVMADFIAEDYVYIDVEGNRIDKSKLFSRRAGDQLSMAEMVDSENEAIVLSPVTVLLRGKTTGTAYYFGGLPRSGSTRWSAIWRKDADGKWRVVAEQTTVVSEPPKYPAAISMPSEAIAIYAGTWRLATRTPMDLTLKADAGALKASIAGQFDDMLFQPSAPGIFFNTLRPFELRFAPNGTTMTFVSWGIETTATRIAR
jgi:ketosteroid isomerase-like protein